MFMNSIRINIYKDQQKVSIGIIYKIVIYLEVKEIIIIIRFCMSIVRELPPEYLENCPTIDGKYKVLYKLGTGRFSK